LGLIERHAGYNPCQHFARETSSILGYGDATESLEATMARPKNLSLLSVEALLKLRDDIGVVLSRKADDLKSQLSRLGGGDGVGISMNGRGRRKSAMKGR